MHDSNRVHLREAILWGPLCQLSQISLSSRDVDAPLLPIDSLTTAVTLPNSTALTSSKLVRIPPALSSIEKHATSVLDNETTRPRPKLSSKIFIAT